MTKWFVYFMVLSSQSFAFAKVVIDKVNDSKSRVVISGTSDLSKLHKDQELTVASDCKIIVIRSTQKKALADARSCENKSVLVVGSAVHGRGRMPAQEADSGGSGSLTKGYWVGLSKDFLTLTVSSSGGSGSLSVNHTLGLRAGYADIRVAKIGYNLVSGLDIMNGSSTIYAVPIYAMGTYGFAQKIYLQGGLKLEDFISGSSASASASQVFGFGYGFALGAGYKINQKFAVELMYESTKHSQTISGVTLNSTFAGFGLNGTYSFQ